jgi:hypothetical protein
VRIYSALSIAGSAIIVCGGMGFAPSMGFAQSIEPGSQAAYCKRLAGGGKTFNESLYEKCMHPAPASASAPPAQSPSSSPPTQPSAGGGKALSPRARQCNRAVADTGLKGTAAQNYLRHCLSAQ